MIITTDWINGEHKWGVFEGNTCVASATHHTRIIPALRRWMKKKGYSELYVRWANDNREELVHASPPDNKSSSKGNARSRAGRSNTLA